MNGHNGNRETEQDLANEAIVLNEVAKWLGCEWTKIKTNGKYSLDCWFVSGNKMIGWGEAKWLSKEGFYGVNVAKYVQGCADALASETPFYYCVRAPGKIGVIEVHDGTWHVAQTTTSVCGKNKTPPNWDDIEPMIMFRPEDMVWIKQKRSG